MKKFPIGFWNYHDVSKLRAKDVSDWVELGMTMANTPNFTPESDKQRMLEILDACEQHGIKAVVCDSRSLWYGAKSNQEEYAKQFGAAYEDFGRHSAVFGFFVGDEPSTQKQWEEACAAYRIQKSVAPELTPFLNLMPYHYWETDGRSVMDIDGAFAWIKRMKEEAGMPLLSYDCYEQMNPEEEGTHTFFKNLKLAREHATKLQIDPWVTLLSAGHFRFRCPTEDDLRWQLNTSIACGMKGIMWFIVYERVCRVNYRLPPFDAFGQRTETFTWLSRTNRYFLHQFGDFFLRAKHIKTFHLGTAYGGYELWKAGQSDDVVWDVTSRHNLPAVIGFFELDGEKYVAVVNNSKTESGFFSVCVPKAVEQFHQWTWNSELMDMKTWKFTTQNEEMVFGGDWHYPGQMKLYRIKR